DYSHQFACSISSYSCFFFTVTPTTQIYTLSLHDALPISSKRSMYLTLKPISPSQNKPCVWGSRCSLPMLQAMQTCGPGILEMARDRKSTRLNSSHVKISYAVFCLKKKKKCKKQTRRRKVT